eukprot:843892-Pyramimonas_sp.AAC.1
MISPCGSANPIPLSRSSNMIALVPATALPGTRAGRADVEVHRCSRRVEPAKLLAREFGFEPVAPVN